MTQADRERLRLKQDFLVMLCEMSGLSEQLRIDEKQGSPTIESLRRSVYPEWEGILDGHINRLADSLSPKVGVPDFRYLSEVAQ